jgi:hypothetical protein
MFNTFKQSLLSWNHETTERQKLQHTYIATALILLVGAGILGLINQPLGQQVLAVAIAAAAVFLVNTIAWALLQSLVLQGLAAKPEATVTQLEASARKPTTRSRKK